MNIQIEWEFVQYTESAWVNIHFLPFLLTRKYTVSLLDSLYLSRSPRNVVDKLWYRNLRLCLATTHQLALFSVFHPLRDYNSEADRWQLLHETVVEKQGNTKPKTAPKLLRQAEPIKGSPFSRHIFFLVSFTRRRNISVVVPHGHIHFYLFHHLVHAISSGNLLFSQQLPPLCTNLPSPSVFFLPPAKNRLNAFLYLLRLVS